MKRDDLIPAGMSAGLYHLLQEMRRHWRAWSPALDYPSRSPGLSTGGLVTGCEDFEEAVDNFAVGVLEVAWDSLGVAHRTSIEQVMGWLPPVAIVREEVLGEAIGRLERACRAQGVL